MDWPTWSGWRLGSAGGFGPTRPAVKDPLGKK